MDATQFLAEFGHIVSAPGGVEKLRGLIFQLAISGRLISIDLTQVPLELVLNEVEESRPSSIFLPLSENEYPFAIPTHWHWQRLEQVAGYIQRGKGPIYANSGSTFVVSQKCIQWSGLDFSMARYIEESSLKDYNNDRYLKAGDLLLNSTGTGTVGRATIYSEKEGIKAVADSHVTVIRPNKLLPRYLQCVFASPWFQAQIDPNHQKSIVSGTTKQVELATSSVKALAIPCPPTSTSEQRRIVAKVDELMALCDKLEAQQLEREGLSKLMGKVVFDRLAVVERPTELESAWSRITTNFSSLLDSREAVTALQETLSQLAVRGYLSEWIDERPPVADIKMACADLKRQYLRKKWIRKQKPVSLPVAIANKYPSHWEVAPFDEIAVIMGGVTKGRKLIGKQMQSCAYLRVANVQRGFFDLSEMKWIEIPVDEIGKYRVESGDLLITEGGDWDTVGRTAIWKDQITNCLHQNHVFKARVASEHLMTEWVELIFNSAIGRRYFAGASKQTTNLASINMTQLRGFPFPIPPFAEQAAILQKIKFLHSTCDALQQKQLDAQKTAQILAVAAIASITGIQPQEKEKMKAPKTELVSNLRLGVAPTDLARAPLAAILANNNGALPAKTLWTMSGLDIDAFYQHLKTEMANGWVVQPEAAYVRELEAS